jgi:hypothetical protein
MYLLLIIKHWICLFKDCLKNTQKNKLYRMDFLRPREWKSHKRSKIFSLSFFYGFLRFRSLIAFDYLHIFFVDKKPLLFVAFHQSTIKSQNFKEICDFLSYLNTEIHQRKNTIHKILNLNLHLMKILIFTQHLINIRSSKDIWILYEIENHFEMCKIKVFISFQ